MSVRSPHKLPRATIVVLAAAAVLALGASVVGAVYGSDVSPGTPSQVAALVAAAPSITSIPSNVTPSLADAANDTASKSTPSLGKCQGDPTTSAPCLYGDTGGTKTMLLWGDSHAFMWFPAVNAIAKEQHWKLVILFQYGCPVADVSVWNSLTDSPYTGCNTYRQSAIDAINKLKPSLVMVTEAFQGEGSNQKPISLSRWTSGLKKTLGSLAPGIKKVVIGDTINLSSTNGASPETCLAANSDNVQACSTSADNAADTAERKSEMTAAKDEHATYVNVVPWSCSTVCTAIVGKMIVYYAEGHFTATYAKFLSTVLYLAIKPSM